MAYITVDELARHLGLESATDDVLLGELIASACKAIDRYVDRTFEAATDSTRYFDRDAVFGRTLVLDGDLCAITSITNGDGATVAGTQYVTLPRNKSPWYALELKPAATVLWDGVSGEIAITGKWAYSTTADDAIKHVTKRLATFYYRQRDNMMEMDRAFATPGGIVLPAKIPNDVADMLATYRRAG